MIIPLLRALHTKWFMLSMQSLKQTKILRKLRSFVSSCGMSKIKESVWRYSIDNSHLKDHTHTTAMSHNRNPHSVRCML